MREQDEGLGMVFDYNADIFNASTIEKMLAHFQNLLEGIAIVPDCCLEDLPMLAPGEQLPQICQNFAEDEETDTSFNQQSEPVSRTLDDIESKLVVIWQEVLGIGAIALRDNFFDLGGSSLLAVKTFAKIEERFGRALPLATLLKAPTIEELATILRKKESSDSWSPLVEIKAGGSKPPLFCIHGGGFNVLVYRNLALNLDPDRPVYGLQARGLDGDKKLVDRIEDMAADYIQQIQTIQAKGPYLLAGLSNGGNIALEMAQQLRLQGETVSLLAMFDSYAPEGIQLLPPKQRFFSSVLYATRYSLPRFVRKTLDKGVLATATQIFKPLKLANQEQELAEDKNIKDATITNRPSTGEPILDRWMNRISEYVIEHSPWFFFTPKIQLQEVEGFLSNTLKQLEETHSKIHKAYGVKPYKGRICLFRASECPPGYRVEPHLGWKNIALEGVEVYQIPGHHTSLMTSPVLVEKMRVVLEKAIDTHCLS
jgi:thioesterase domain-containing protein/acyl carrier protein